MPREQYWAVRRGKVPGVYTTEQDAFKQIDGFLGAQWKVLPNHEAAQKWARIGDYKIKNSPSTLRPTIATLQAVRAGTQSRRSYSGEVASAQSLFANNNLVDSDSADTAIEEAEVEEDTKPIFKGIGLDQCPRPVPINKAGMGEEPHIKLSPQQEHVLELVKSGQNVFFTGSAGVGKSVLLRHIVKALEEMSYQSYDSGEDDKWVEETKDAEKAGLNELEAIRPRPYSYALTASTGLAAMNVGGSTLHSWAGIGLAKRDEKSLAESVLREDHSRRRWRETQTLIIDEISMIKGQLLDKLDYIGRFVRKVEKPFGGLQVIICGDFLQLPPVPDWGETPDGVKFAFDAKCWDRLIPSANRLELTQIYRQADRDFISILETIRKGKPTPAQVMMLKQCQRQVKYEDDFEPVGLYSTKVEVQNIIDNRLKSLSGDSVYFHAEDYPGLNAKKEEITRQQATDLLNTNTLWQESLALKIGAQVMCVTNFKHSAIVNGSTGLVVAFMTRDEARQEGVSFPDSTDHITNEVEKWPVVEFIPSRHSSATKYARTIIPQAYIDVYNANNQVEATRLQVPLILSWAMTTHKGQGQTIERLRIDMHKVFADGQAYVALSRATSLDNVELLNFHSNKVKTNRRVLLWHRDFEAAQFKRGI